MERTACFIDDGYLQNVVRDVQRQNDNCLSESTKWKIDYSRLADRMKGNEDLLRTYYYTCKLPENDDYDCDHNFKQKQFFYSLQKINQFECKFGTLERRYQDDGTYCFVQKQVDVLLAIDIVTLSLKHLITKANIISGDADLIPAVKFAKSEGVVVELFYTAGTASNELLQTVDIATEIDAAWLEEIRMHG